MSISHVGVAEPLHLLNLQHSAALYGCRGVVRTVGGEPLLGCKPPPLFTEMANPRGMKAGKCSTYVLRFDEGCIRYARRNPSLTAQVDRQPPPPFLRSPMGGSTGWFCSIFSVEDLYHKP